MEKTILEVKNLTVEYRTDKETVHAVNNISFKLNQGKTLGLVGETGAGKTTTALALIRLLPERTGFIKEGSVTLDGTDILGLKEKAMKKVRGNKISMIFQDPMTSLNPIQTVGQQIFEVFMLHNEEHLSKKELDKKVDETLKLVGIPPERKKEYPHQFSGGMKQRVVIAMALACEPILLLADEPTTALDVTIQAQVLAMMRELKTRLNTSMIMITHDLGVVAETCDEVAVMYAGEIIEYGTMEDIFGDKQHHPYTVGLFGSIPDLEEEAERLHPIDGLMPDPTNLPEGCAFSPRCPHCSDRCRTNHPVPKTNGTHMVCCHLFDEEDA